MPRFRWIEWNLEEITAHAQPARTWSTHSSATSDLTRKGAMAPTRRSGTDELGSAASGRVIAIVWRYDEEFDPLEDEGTAEVVFVITAF